MSQQNLRVMVTGGSGFIGSAVCRHLAGQNNVAILNYDKLTYAASQASLAMLEGKADYQFVQGDVADAARVSATIKAFRPDVVMHLAAESHVDRSITGPGEFIQTNIVGTYVMLQAALEQASAELRAANEQLGFVHPLNRDWDHISFCQIAAPLERIDGVLTAANAVVIRPGKIDRSPCGTGCSARMAVLHAKGQMQENEDADVERENPCDRRGQRIALTPALAIGSEAEDRCNRLKVGGGAVRRCGRLEIVETNLGLVELHLRDFDRFLQALAPWASAT